MSTCTLERRVAAGVAQDAYRNLGKQIESAHRLHFDHPLLPGPAQLDGLLNEIHETHTLLSELSEGLATDADRVTVEHTTAFKRAMTRDPDGGDA